MLVKKLLFCINTIEKYAFFDRGYEIIFQTFKESESNYMYCIPHLIDDLLLVYFVQVCLKSLFQNAHEE